VSANVFDLELQSGLAAALGALEGKVLHVSSPLHSIMPLKPTMVVPDPPRMMVY
jgi:hypothetical protein